MRTYLDCVPCLMSQALRAARTVLDDEEAVGKAFREIFDIFKTIDIEKPPPVTGGMIHKEIRKILKVGDPFGEIKKMSIRQALDLYPDLKKIVKRSESSLKAAVRLAIAGNVIDLGVNKSFDINLEIGRVMHQQFAIMDWHEFMNELLKAESILFLGDNAGETVFDRILIEELKRPVVYAVRESPVINDAVREDAILSGIDKVAEIISTGSDLPGVVPEQCSNAFLGRFKSADMVISKGQGNYEGLSETERPVFFLLKAKCHVIAKDLGVAENSIVLKALNV